MSDLFLNPDLIANLNTLQNIPIQILKLIVDRVLRSVIHSSDCINEDQLQILLKNQRIQNHQWKKGISTLRYFIKHCLKYQVPPKALLSFFSENTLFSTDFSQYLGQNYADKSLKKQENPKIAVINDTNWSLFNLKLAKGNQILNKIYLKNKITTNENGHSQDIVFITQLPEFKFLKSQIQLIGAKIQ